MTRKAALAKRKPGVGGRGRTLKERRRGLGSVQIERAGCACAGAVEEVEVDHGSFNRGMAEERLEGTDVGAALEEVGGERMAEGMTGGTFGDGRSADGIGELSLEGIFPAPAPTPTPNRPRPRPRPRFLLFSSDSFGSGAVGGADVRMDGAAGCRSCQAVERASGTLSGCVLFSTESVGVRP